MRVQEGATLTAPCNRLHPTREGGDISVARFLIPGVSQSDLSEMRGFMRAAVYIRADDGRFYKFRRSSIENRDRAPLTLRPARYSRMLSRPQSGNKDARLFPGLFDNLNRHRDNNVRITSSPMRASARSFSARITRARCARFSVLISTSEFRRFLFFIPLSSNDLASSLSLQF